MTVGASGHVIRIRQVDAYGLSTADRAALTQASHRARFEPVLSGSEPVPFALWTSIRGYEASITERVATTSTLPAPVEQAIPDDVPGFTPMSVRPALLNGAEIAPALSAAVPAEARAAGTQVGAVLWLHVGTDGGVQRSVVFTSSGSDAFDAAALDIAARMRFSPALNRDQAVPVWVQVPMRFRPQTTGAN
jgi:TonB family protein